MEDYAKLLVIGGGIVGCGIAYHASRMGLDDIVVIEQGPLFEAGGSTSHAPGLVFQTNFSRTMTEFAKYTVDLLSGLASETGEPCYYRVGGLEIATTTARVEDLKRKRGAAMSWGIESRLIDPEEAKELIPLLDESKLFGAYYVPSDGIAKAVRASGAMANKAKAKGSRFYGGTRVTGIETSNGRVQAVSTDRGRIAAERVVLCGGIWGPMLARMAGHGLPLSPVQHLYAQTDPLPELSGERREVVHPVLRHQDRSMYFRQQRDCYGVGSYLHAPLLVDDEDIRPHGASRLAPAIREFTPEYFEEGWRSGCEVIPALKQRNLTSAMNGMFSFTVDGMPILGESRKPKGLWFAEGVWITHSCGVAKAVAEWLVDGRPSLDLRECDVNRFHEYAYGRRYTRERAAQQYREVYDIIHPLQQIRSPRNLRLAPFHQRLEELGAVFFENAGWERPQWFNSNERLVEERHRNIRTGWEARFWSPVQAAEHVATREKVAMFDLTPFTKLDVSGPGSLALLQRLCANQIDRPLGRVVYTSMLDDAGGIVCDLTVTRLGEERFLVVTGGAMGMHDLAWMESHVPTPTGGDASKVQISDLSAAFCCIGLWGPSAPSLLQTLVDGTPTPFKPFTSRPITVGQVPVLALGVSYVGESGWELYTDTGYGRLLWDTLMSARDDFGLVPAGGGAFDSLRLEKGYRLWGSDIHSEYNPLEAGLDFAVNFDKGDFIGRDSLLKVKDSGLNRKLCRMYFDEPWRVVMGKEPITTSGRTVGYVTSSNYGYTLDRGIAYGYLPIDVAKEGEKVEVLYFGKQHPATVAAERHRPGIFL